MHKTTLCFFFFAGMRVTLCLLQNKHLRASEASHSALWSLFFFSALWRRTSGEERHADQKERGNRHSDTLGCQKFRLLFQLHTSISTHCHDPPPPPPPPNLRLQNFPLRRRFTEIPNENHLEVLRSDGVAQQPRPYWPITNDVAAVMNSPFFVFISNPSFILFGPQEWVQ